MKSIDTKNILICPLNWGTGHATRVQVIAGELKKRGHKIYIAASRRLHETFDKSVYDELIPLWSASVYYSGHLPLYIAMMFQIPVLLASFLADRLRLPRIIRNYDIHLLISDNCFGMWSRKIYSIYITHQLRVAVPRGLGFARPLVTAIHRSVAARYDECWIPDLPGDANLSGMLSHECKIPANTHYIGPLSRMSFLRKQESSAHANTDGTGLESCASIEYESPFTLALLSGPEPQRTILENLIIARKDILPGKLIIVAGTPGDNKQTDDEIMRYPWLDGPDLKHLMEKADLIICRSGYSTIMDLYDLGRGALLVPTPGQPEQEHLAHHLAGKYNLTTVEQKQLAQHGDLPVVNNDIKWPEKNTDLPGKVLDRLLIKLQGQARG
ncbi:MAG: hypothetical protein JW965_01975 [Bacteroidales bacterium]|nr:hypothetical protein [Bacteroidales bacterium]